MVNTALGYRAVSPWDVDDLPADDVDDLVRLARTKQQLDEADGV
jgi:hypothetical protein